MPVPAGIVPVCTMGMAREGKQQAMPVPAGIVPVCTMGMAREGTCRLEQMHRTDY
jgi:hypothetical protein